MGKSVSCRSFSSKSILRRSFGSEPRHKSDFAVAHPSLFLPKPILCQRFAGKSVLCRRLAWNIGINSIFQELTCGLAAEIGSMPTFCAQNLARIRFRGREPSALSASLASNSSRHPRAALRSRRSRWSRPDQSRPRLRQHLHRRAAPARRPRRPWQSLLVLTWLLPAISPNSVFCCNSRFPNWSKSVIGGSHVPLKQVRQL